MIRKLLSLIACILILSGAVYAQGTVTGTVTDKETGDTFPGVNVVIPQLQIGAATNANGEYTIKNVPAGTYTITASFVGYKKYTAQIQVSDGEKVVHNIVLVPSVVGLNDVVVTAYGISRGKNSVAYQTQSVSSEDLNNAEVTSVAEGLVGKVAGLQINTQTSGVNSQKQILLRGLRSISGNNEALIVIDGSIASQSAFNDLNPNDIKSVDVLKGATAASLYGSNASNGALIVTTKQGDHDGLKVKYNHSTTWREVAYMPDFQSKFGSGWDGVYTPGENTNWGPRFDGQMRRIGPDFPADYPLDNQMVPYAPVKDNLKNFFNRGATAQNTISLSGGNESGSFYLSVGDQQTDGIVPNDEYKKYNFTANGSKELGDVTLGVNASFFKDNKNVVGNNIGAQDRAFYWFVLNNPKEIPLNKYSNWQDPTSYGYPDNYYNAYYENPYWAIGTNRDKSESKRLRGNISASWDIIDNINVTGRLGVNTVSGIGKDYRAAQHYDPQLKPSMTDVPSYVTDSEYQNTQVTGNLVAKGDFQLTEAFGLNAILGSSVETHQYRGSSMTANNLSIPNFFDISNGTGKIDASVNESQKRTFGVFGDFTFNYKEWAYLNVTGRQDFTSTLPSDNNSYFYPSAGLSLVLSKAIPAIGDIPFLSLLKVTANNSTVYKDLNPYQVNETYSQSGSFPFGTINGFYLSGTAIDNNIKKEKLNSTEFGLNTAFFDGRVTFDASYYFTKTTNLITNISPSIASGSTGYLTNIGQLSGNGMEFSLGGNVIEAKDFSWNVNLNYTSYEQKVDEIQPGADEIAIESYNAGYGTYAIKDMVFPQIKAVSYVRDPQGRVVIDPETGNPLIGDLKPMGKTTPDYTLGLNTSVNYKGLTVSATMDYRTGYVYYAQGLDIMEFTGRSIESASANRQNFVFPNSSYPDGNGGYTENTNIPISGGTMDFWQNHYNQIKENYVKDATAFKLRELSVNYSIPVELISKTRVISKLSVGLVAHNLLTILPDGQTKFSDPEFKNTGGGYDQNGIGVGGYLTPPPTRSYGFVVNIEF